MPHADPWLLVALLTGILIGLLLNAVLSLMFMSKDPDDE